LRLDANRADNLTIDTAADHRELLRKVEGHADADYIVLDGPPRIAEMTRSILLLSDLCLLPVGASVAEVWATGDVVTIIDEARQVQPVNVRLVWTRHRAYTTLAHDLTSTAGKALKLKALNTTLGLRVAYPEALGSGLTVTETGDPVARDEFNGFMAEVRRILNT
jgi:chromosome partitioning protein